MIFPQAIFGGLLALALAIVVVAVSGSGSAQQSGGFDGVTPSTLQPGLQVIVQINTSNGGVRACRVEPNLSMECGDWTR